MADVTEAVLANREKQVVFWDCCCHSVVLASDYVQTAAVKTVDTAAHHWLSERPVLASELQPRPPSLR